MPLASGQIESAVAEPRGGRVYMCMWCPSALAGPCAPCQESGYTYLQPTYLAGLLRAHVRQIEMRSGLRLGVLRLSVRAGVTNERVRSTIAMPHNPHMQTRKEVDAVSGGESRS